MGNPELLVQERKALMAEEDSQDFSETIIGEQLFKALRFASSLEKIGWLLFWPIHVFLLSFGHDVVSFCRFRAGQVMSLLTNFYSLLSYPCNKGPSFSYPSKGIQGNVLLLAPLPYKLLFLQTRLSS